ncbi:hypothetical protein ACWEQL_28840 [Kitasatospora sp. NPDC004240]
MTTGPAWVHPALLSAECVAVEQVALKGRPWLMSGVHLRVFPSPRLGFPICPFTVWRAGRATSAHVPRPVSDGMVYFTGLGRQALVVGAWGPDTISVADPAGRLGPSCSGPNPFVARVPLPGFRCWGDPDRLAVAEYRDGPSLDGSGHPTDPPSWLSATALDALGAPPQIEVGPWWCGTDPSYPSADRDYRVSEGIPFGVAPPYDPQDRDPRERAQASARHLEDKVAEAWSRGVDDLPPLADARITQSLSGIGQNVTVNTDLAVPLWVSAADPAVARWWGFATTLDRQQVSPDEAVSMEHADCFAVAALFVIQEEVDEEFMNALLPDPADWMHQEFTNALYRAHRQADLESMAEELKRPSRKVVCLWTIAVATPPPDLPSPPEVGDVPGLTRWNPASAPDGEPDGTWTATLSVRNTLGGPLAVRRESGEWLNPPTEQGDDWRQPILAPSAGPGTRAVAVTDCNCSGRSASWQVATADLWGQWSDFGSSGEVPQPARPEPPTPGVVLDYTQADPPPAGSALASPGTITIMATVPASPAGCAPVSGVEAELVGAHGSSQLRPQGIGRWEATVRAPETSPGTSTNLRYTVIVHHNGGPDTSASAALTVHDPRPYVNALQSEVILFSGDRRPDGYAELDIRTNRPPGAPSGTTWRLYAGEEQSPRTGANADTPRWRRAGKLRDKTTAGQTPMARVTDATITEASGRLRIRCRLPGRLEALQALQLVPVGRSGLEAPRDRRGCCVVAVPLTDTPPAPLLTCVLDPDGTTVHLAVTLRLPGAGPVDGRLAPPIARRVGGHAAAGTLPVIRVRRSAAGGAPATWPVLRTMELSPVPPGNPAEGWRWACAFDDHLPPGTPAWSPLAYMCEAAWPAEPTYEPGSTPIEGDFHQTWGLPATDPRPGMWSAPSEVHSVAAPRPLPRVVPRYTAHGGGAATLDVTVPPTHPAAPPWTLTATAPSSGPTSMPPSASVTGVGPELHLDGLLGWPPPDRWLVALTTPDGRTLPMVTGNGAIPP